MYVMQSANESICEICDRKSASIIQESVDISARWVEQNDMRIKGDDSWFHS